MANSNDEKTYVKVTLQNSEVKDINLMPKTLISQVVRATESGGCEPSELEKDNLEYILEHMSTSGLVLTDETTGLKYQLSMKLELIGGEVKCRLVAEEI